MSGSSSTVVNRSPSTGDGKDRWVLYTYDKKDKLASAEIDPDHVVLLDKNFYNNSYVREEDATAKWKIVSYMAHSWPF